jgi:hypothetical protein
MRRSTLPSHHLAELVHTIDVPRLGIEQLNDAPKVIGKITTRQVSGVEIPNPGPAGKLTRARTSVEDLALAMSPFRRDRQESGDLRGVELVARKPQGRVAAPVRDGAVLQYGDAVGTAEPGSSPDPVHGVREVSRGDAEALRHPTRRVFGIAP